jgi:hypothetical protein
MKKTIPLLLMLSIAMPAFAVVGAPETESTSADSLKRNLRQEVREDIKEKREVVKVEVKKTREESKEKISALRQDLEKMREQGKKDLKAKLAKIKDVKKREATERINDNIAKLNKERTEQFGDVLNKLSSVLDRVDERANRAGSKGVDVANAKTAIATARQAITDANTVVKVQSEKIYTITVTDEATLKQKVGEVRQQLRDDLTKVHDVVKSAREAVRNAATTLAKTPRVNEAPEAVAPVATTTNNQ